MTPSLRKKDSTAPGGIIVSVKASSLRTNRVCPHWRLLHIKQMNSKHHLCSAFTLLVISLSAAPVCFWFSSSVEPGDVVLLNGGDLAAAKYVPYLLAKPEEVLVLEPEKK